MFSRAQRLAPERTCTCYPDASMKPSLCVEEGRPVVKRPYSPHNGTQARRAHTHPIRGYGGDLDYKPWMTGEGYFPTVEMGCLPHLGDTCDGFIISPGTRGRKVFL